MTKQKFAEKCIEDALLQGRWKLSERLPSERELAAEFGINRGTLRAALRTLSGKGILETVHGSGTTVQALPQKCVAHKCTLKPSLEGLRALLPPLMLSEHFVVTPGRILEMERILPMAGAALRSGNIKDFAWCQSRFLLLLAQCLENPCLIQAAKNILPDATLLNSATHEFSLIRQEEIFAVLARVLSELRRINIHKASEGVERYASLILDYLKVSPREQTSS